MPRVTISDELRDVLRAAAGGRIELADSSGELVGRLVRYTRLGDDYVEGDWPPAGSDPAADPGRWRTSDEVMTVLRKITEAMS